MFTVRGNVSLKFLHRVVSPQDKTSVECNPLLYVLYYEANFKSLYCKLASIENPMHSHDGLFCIHLLIHSQPISLRKKK